MITQQYYWIIVIQQYYWMNCFSVGEVFLSDTIWNS